MMAMFYSLIYQQDGINQIKEKIANAPDKSYEIGVAIGTFLPLVVLVLFAFLLFRYSKKRRE